MKRYLLFTGYQYYPLGGWSDFKGSFDSIPEALIAARAVGEDWHQIIDTQNPPRAEDV